MLSMQKYLHRSPTCPTQTDNETSYPQNHSLHWQDSVHIKAQALIWCTCVADNCSKVASSGNKEGGI